MEKFILKKCLKCGAIVEILKDCDCENCGIKCCGQVMEEIKSNTIECAIEKHIPNYEIVGNYIAVTIPHVMEKEHFIAWVGLIGKNINAKKFFTEGETPKAIFPYIKGSIIYAYCNKHGLWSKEVL